MNYERDETFTPLARNYLLRGAGEYPAEGIAADLGFDRVVVKPFSTGGVDVWFYMPDDPCNCRSHHVEFGRTGGEIFLSDALTCSTEDDA